MIGRSVGKYRIVGQLGRGAMGTVYRAVDVTLDREVAIKVLNPELADPKLIKRFRSEATALARLNHPGIATIHELFPSEADLLIVMELVRGETLESICARTGALPPVHAACLADRILSALAHAHRAGVVHCDIKPANVMVTEQGGIKIMDFGTARVRDAERATTDGYLMGTPAYMSPEQVLGQPVDPRTDLYSVAVVLYRLLSGVLPFDAETAIATVQQQISKQPPPLRSHREDLPEWCEPTVQRALAKAPADRFQSADEFRRALSSASGAGSATFEQIELAQSLGIVSREDKPAESSSPPVKTLVLDDRSATGSGLATGQLIRIYALAAVLLFAAIAAVTISGRRHAAGPAAHAASPLRTALPTRSTVAEPPFVTDATVLPHDGTGRERRTRIELTNSKVRVETIDGRSVVNEVRFDDIVSVSYSRGLDPMWNARTGPARVMRANPGTLGSWGIFVPRDWVSLRVANAETEFIVLRFDEEYRARRLLAALEKRTGRKSDVVAARRED